MRNTYEVVLAAIKTLALANAAQAAVFSHNVVLGASDNFARPGKKLV